MFLEAGESHVGIPPAAARVAAHHTSFRLLPLTHPPSDLQGSRTLLNLQPTLKLRVKLAAVGAPGGNRSNYLHRARFCLSVKV